MATSPPTINAITLPEFFKDSVYYTSEKNVSCVFWQLRYIEGLNPLAMFERCLGMDIWLLDNVAIEDFKYHVDKAVYGDMVFYTKIWFRNDIDLVAFRLRWGHSSMIDVTIHTVWVTIQIQKFISTKELNEYFQDGIRWDMDHRFIDMIGGCITTVYIQDPEEALIFKLRFKL